MAVSAAGKIPKEEAALFHSPRVIVCVPSIKMAGPATCSPACKSPRGMTGMSDLPSPSK
jgi:hypothetical protein